MTFRVYKIIFDVYTERGCFMAPRTGRPPAENPKNIQLKIRADAKLMEDLDHCCAALGKTRSDIIRLGIQKIKEDVDKK